MKSFSNILAIAALAYTANAGMIRAGCMIMNSDGAEQGRINLSQRYSMQDEAAIGDSTINYGVRDVETETIHSLMILENTTGDCMDATATNPLATIVELKSSRSGMTGVRGFQSDL